MKKLSLKFQAQHHVSLENLTGAGQQQITPAIRCGAPPLRSGASSALSNALIWGLIFARCFGTFRAQAWKTPSKRRIAGFVK